MSRREKVYAAWRPHGSRADSRQLGTSRCHAATLLSDFNVGNDKAAAELVVVLYSELRRLASGYLRRERSDHTLQTTALVHEAYLRLANQRESWKDREQFMDVATQLMRRILVDYSRGHDAKKRGQDFEKVFLEEAEVGNIMSGLFSHAIRYEMADRNPITAVQQSSKPERVPVILEVEELRRLFGEPPLKKVGWHTFRASSS
jgi:DNA-directed RNA polymerase specialized sigma24 family protein